MCAMWEGARVIKKLNTQRFYKNESGSIAMMSSVAILVLVLAVGVAVDFTRLASSRALMQDNSDIVALQSALTIRKTPHAKKKKQIKDTKESVILDFKARMAQETDVTISDVVLEEIDDQTIRLTAKAHLEPKFLQMFGRETLDVSVASDVDLGQPMGSEIVLAIDTTNSMTFGTRWSTSLDSAGKVMEEIQALAGGKDVFIGLVPFQDRVNIGTSGARSAWLDGSPPTAASPNDWRGCVEPREFVSGPLGWAVDDASPTTSLFDYTTKNLPGGLGDRSSGIACPSDEIVAPTKDIKKIIREVKSLTPSGTGRPDVGLAWAWRMVSVNWRDQWGVSDYPALSVEDRRKYVLLMTDGNTIAYSHEMDKNNDMGHNNGSTTGWTHLEALCTSVKAQDIQLYILDIGNNAHVEPYFKRCASTADHYIEVEGPEDVETVFSDILVQHQANIRVVR